MPRYWPGKKLMPSS